MCGTNSCMFPFHFSERGGDLHQSVAECFVWIPIQLIRSLYQKVLLQLPGIIRDCLSPDLCWWVVIMSLSHICGESKPTINSTMVFDRCLAININEILLNMISKILFIFMAMYNWAGCWFSRGNKQTLALWSNSHCDEEMFQSARNRTCLQDMMLLWNSAITILIRKSNACFPFSL